MKIKTYQALTMQEALKQIKAELGPDAVILSTKKVRATSGTLALLGKHLVEVMAAIDPASIAPSAPSNQPAFQAALQYELHGKPAAEPERPAPPPAAGSRSAEEWEQLRAEMGQLREQLQSLLRNQQEPVSEPPAPQRKSEPVERRSRILDLVSNGATTAPATQDAPIRPIRVEGRATDAAPKPIDPTTINESSAHRNLVSHGVLPEFATRLLTAVRAQADRIDLRSEAAIRHALHQAISQELSAGGPLLSLGEWKKTVIVVGPTGVGKTTTIAKLAAHYRVKEKRNVSLITLDTYRMAAVEQLRSYAKLLDIPLEVALTKSEALTYIRRHSKAELILIDTAGRSPRDEAGMEELRQLMTLDHPLETHLVLSATTRDQDLHDSLARYAGLPVHRLLFTKLDETTSYGGIFNAVQRAKTPLSYLGVGQNVPEDLMVARPEFLADLILGGALPAAAKTDHSLKMDGQGTGTKLRRAQVTHHV
jgi:flagellar biosynthesis protein FlhF